MLNAGGQMWYDIFIKNFRTGEWRLRLKVKDREAALKYVQAHIAEKNRNYYSANDAGILMKPVLSYA